MDTSLVVSLELTEEKIIELGVIPNPINNWSIGHSPLRCYSGRWGGQGTNEVSYLTWILQAMLSPVQCLQ
jgi:hypothetical protein